MFKWRGANKKIKQQRQNQEFGDSENHLAPLPSYS